MAAVTNAYRQRLDQTPASVPHVQCQLELAFSRGLSTGWLEGVNHRRLVHCRWSKKRGPLLGQLLRVERGGWLHLCSRELLHPGQGLVLEQLSSDPLQPPREIGGRIMVCERIGDERWKLRLGSDRVDGSGLRYGASVWLTSDPDWQSRWQRAARRTVEARARNLALRVSGRLDAPLEVQLLSPQGLDLTLSSTMPLQTACQRPLDRERLQEQLGRLGGIGWFPQHQEIQLQGDLFLPVAELNRMRRALFELLEASLHDNKDSSQEHSHFEPTDPTTLLARMCPPPPAAPLSETKPGLAVLVRNLEQLRELVYLSREGLPIRSVVADLDQPRELREAVAIGRGCWPEGVWLVVARITRPDERWSLEPLILARPDGFLVRNADQLEVLTPLAPCTGDLSLNTANPLSFH